MRKHAYFYEKKIMILLHSKQNKILICTFNKNCTTLLHCDLTEKEFIGNNFYWYNIFISIVVTFLYQKKKL